MAFSGKPRALCCEKLFRAYSTSRHRVNSKYSHASLKVLYPCRMPKTAFSNASVASWRGNTNARLTWATQEIGKLMKSYEDFVGVTDIKQAQAKVVEAERQFVEIQELRREKQNTIQQVQFRLKEIHSEMDKVSRGEDRFYELFNKEHSVIKQEKELVRELDTLERDEKQRFLFFSTAIRETHETERVHSERTKYWPIIGSFITFLGASIYGIYRFHKLQSILSESVGGGSEAIGRLERLLTDVGDSVTSQHRQLTGFVGDLKTMLTGDGSSESSDAAQVLAQMLPQSSVTRDADDATTLPLSELEATLSDIRAHSMELTSDIVDIKRMIAAGTVTGGGDGEDGGPTVVYVGPEMRQLLRDNEARLEFRIKANAMATVVSVYVAFALTLPLLYAIFKGGGAV